VTQPSCLRRRRSHRRWRARARLNRPADVSDAMRLRCRAAYLDEVLALGLGHQRLQLWCGEGVDEARLGHDEEQHLRAGQDRQLVGLGRLAGHAAWWWLACDARNAMRAGHNIPSS
jgi:hypothetical protein